MNLLCNTSLYDPARCHHGGIQTIGFRSGLSACHLFAVFLVHMSVVCWYPWCGDCWRYSGSHSILVNLGLNQAALAAGQPLLPSHILLNLSGHFSSFGWLRRDFRSGAALHA